MTTAETIVNNLNTSEYMARVNCQLVICNGKINLHKNGSFKKVLFEGQPLEHEGFLAGLIRGIEIVENGYVDKPVAKWI